AVRGQPGGAPPPPRPPGFWFLHRQGDGPDAIDPLQIDCPGAPGALAAFSSPRVARVYRKQVLGPEWELYSLRRAYVLDWLAEVAGRGAGHVVLDPSPQAPGQGLTGFQALVEWP